MSVVPVGPKATAVVCPSCNASVVTKVDRKFNICTHILLILIYPCTCVPYCDSCNDPEHYCPSCKAHIGTHRG